MKANGISRFLLWATPLVLILSACVVPATGQVVGALLWQDNFTKTDGGTCDVNANYTDPGRQSSVLGPISYTDLIYPTTEDPNTHLSGGNILKGYAYLGVTGLPGGDGTLAVTGNYNGDPFPTLRLNKNFNGALSSGGFTISYDTRIDGPYWNGIMIGGDSTIQWGYTTQTTQGFYMQLGWKNAETGFSQFSAGDIVDGSLASGSLDVDLGAALHHFDFVCTDPIDGNPFNGSGQTQIDAYLDHASTPFFSWVKTSDYSNNYVALATLTHDGAATGPAGGYTAYAAINNYGLPGYYSYWDNLQIYGNAVNQWGGADGNWNDAAKWTLGTVPNSAGETVRFWGLNTAATTVNVDADVTVGALDFDSVNSYTISGTHTITFNNPGLDNLISVKGNHIISAPMVQTSTLIFKFNSPTDRLVLAGSIDTVGGSGQYWLVNSGILVVSGNSSPNGVVDVTGGILALVPGGTLTASQVQGSGQLWIEGGNLAYPGGGSKPGISIDVLGLGMDAGTTGEYSVDAGETLTARLVTGGGASGGTGNLHLNGGTVAGRAAVNYIADLTATYLDDDSTISAGSGPIVFARSNLQDGALKAGHLTINGTVYFQTANTYSGGTTVTNGTLVLDNAGGMGTGPATFETGSCLYILGNTVGTVTNDLTFNGPVPSSVGIVPTIYFDWGAKADLAGKITVNNDASGNPTNIGGTAPTPGAEDHILTISGQITGPGGLMFGFPNASWHGAWNGFTSIISGNVSNNYAGDTSILDCKVILAKTDGAIAIPSANVTLGSAVAYPDPTTPMLRLGGDNQINPAAVLTMNAARDYNSFELMGHSQTLGGLRSNDGVNVISNQFFTAAPTGSVGTLTINSTSPDDYYFGIIRDGWAGITVDNQFAMVKDGPGTLTLKAGGNGWLSYTGSTTVNDGALIITSVDAEGGVSTANTLTGDFTGAGTVVVGDGVNHPVLNLTKVDMTGTLQVADLATLNVASLKADTLIIGGTPIVPVAASAVPEPSVMLLLAIAGIAFVCIRLKK